MFQPNVIESGMFARKSSSSSLFFLSRKSLLGRLYQTKHMFLIYLGMLHIVSVAMEVVHPKSRRIGFLVFSLSRLQFLSVKLCGGVDASLREKQNLWN